MTGKLRDLPELPTFVAEVAHSIGDVLTTTSILANGEWPAAAVAMWGISHLLLIRDHKHAVTISLPVNQSWSLQTLEEWRIAEPEVKTAVLAYHALYPKAVTMADVIVALAPALARITNGERWSVDFPGTQVPSEGWLKSTDGRRSVGVFQNTTSVRAVVWVSGKQRALMVNAPNKLTKLGVWVKPMLVEQEKALMADEAEAKRKAALPIPTLEDVLTALRAGREIMTGGGRCNTTYFLEGTTLRCRLFDEGYTETTDATEATLRADIERYPDDYRNALARR